MISLPSNVGIRILFVDDREEIRSIITSLLTDQGYLVDSVASVEQAINLDLREYGIIVSDFDLGQGRASGLTFLSIAKKLDLKAKFFMFTGSNVEKSFYAMGGDKFFDKTEISAMIKAVKDSYAF